MKQLPGILQTIFISIIFCVMSARPDGFVAGTLVKVPSGYAAIETLKVGSIVCCADRNAAVIEQTVIATTVEEHPTAVIAVHTGAHTMITSSQQKFFVRKTQNSTNTWAAAQDLTAGNYLISITNASGTPVKSLEAKDCTPTQTPALYNLCVAEGHNYFVTQQDFVVHNFFPDVSRLFSQALSHSSAPLKLFEIGFKEGGGQWEFYYKFLTLENIIIVVVIGLFIYALCKAFNSHKDDDHDHDHGGNDGGDGRCYGCGIRYQPNQSFVHPSDPSFSPGKILKGTHDGKGNPIVDDWQRQENYRQAAERNRLEQEKWQRSFVEEDHRKRNEQLRQAELRQEEAAAQQARDTAISHQATRIQAFVPEPITASSCAIKPAQNANYKPLDYASMPGAQVALPTPATSASSSSSIAIAISTVSDLRSDTQALGNVDASMLLQKLHEAQCKQQVLDQVRDALSSPAKSFEWEQAPLLDKLQEFVATATTPEDAFAYGQLTVALTKQLMSATPPGPKMDFLERLKASTDRFIDRTNKILTQRIKDLADNPVPMAVAVAAGTCIAPEALAIMAVQAAIAFHQEIIAGMCAGCKNMAQLLANDPPEAFAQVTAFIAECMAFTKTVGVASEVINVLAPHLSAVESLYKSFIEKVQQSEAQGLSAVQAASNTTKLAPQAEAAASAKAIEVAESGIAAKKVNDVESLSKGVIDHATNEHLPEKVTEQIPFMLKKSPKVAVEEFIAKSSYFNKNWNREKVEQAVAIVFNDAVKLGIKGKAHSMQVFGEKVTVYISNNGYLRTAYGNHKYSLSDFGYE